MEQDRLFVMMSESGVNSCGADCAETLGLLLLHLWLEREGFSKKELYIMGGSINEKQLKQLKPVVTANSSQVRILEKRKEGKIFLFCTIRGMALIHPFLGDDERFGNLTKNELIELAFSKGESEK